MRAMAGQTAKPEVRAVCPAAAAALHTPASAGACCGRLTATRAGFKQDKRLATLQEKAKKGNAQAQNEVPPARPRPVFADSMRPLVCADCAVCRARGADARA